MWPAKKGDVGGHWTHIGANFLKMKILMGLYNRITKKGNLIGSVGPTLDQNYQKRQVWWVPWDPQQSKIPKKCVLVDTQWDEISQKGNCRSCDFLKKEIFDENFFILGKQNCLFRKYWLHKPSKLPKKEIWWDPHSKKGNFWWWHMWPKNHFGTEFLFLVILMGPTFQKRNFFDGSIYDLKFILEQIFFFW